MGKILATRLLGSAALVICGAVVLGISAYVETNVSSFVFGNLACDKLIEATPDVSRFEPLASRPLTTLSMPSLVPSQSLSSWYWE
jgi:hypothetical protein